MSARGGPSTPRKAPKLTEEEAEKLYTRLYADAITHKEIALKKLDAKYYPTEKPKRVDAEKIAELVDKHAVKEVEHRRTRLAQSEKANEKQGSTAGGNGKKLNEEEVDESVRRLYNDSVRIRGETHKRLEQKYTFHNHAVESGRQKKLSKEELTNFANRLSIPVKKTFDADEINKIYGFKVTPRQQKHDEEEEAEE